MAAYCTSKNTVDLAIDPLILCKLCLSECPLDAMYELVDCKCLFCEVCMRQYLAVLITEGMVAEITCPDAQCKKQGKLSVKEIEKLVDKQAFLRYKRLHFQREVDLDPNRTFCPEIGCETVCHVCSSQAHAAGAGAATVDSVPVQCPTCGLQFCSVCKTKWHAPKSCDEVVTTGALEEVGIPFNNTEDAKIKRCPVCHVPIERNDGCAQMMCKRCKHVFCWYCLQSLDDDFLLRHYDKGPCKNKLGHSRASVIWHRTQVVGIFAGFGVLLLVASPFLLLAAPCILCCKCKVCRCCQEEEGDGFST
ncbi:E3 ubiquitin-protein ligase RNF144A [Aplysia californica]|uniref:RBR-type E3 ubiquitin transferase n=1 Tax=Aplysia californica TaxID=6500 RepID=A0ABM1VVK7_APLCA|nr:E3 ubiquitin-protein ligase RNF144A [Aplysia californica]XP_035826448.1 E3 ubiquitin-protein ligase RNF144A [Aplysia californica]XP_035826449.1 E3 ubiquitin-protein ligase RNF144A [Aplysia californica]